MITLNKNKMATVKQAAFSDTRKMVLQYRNLSRWMRRLLWDLGAWVLAFFLFFAMMQTVIWVAVKSLQ
ncbi:MAG TPA: hypothetical protein PLD84_03520 [Chitinophagales bacterium]|nr:hypothetical protein [Chitinophagales bacterium]